MLIVISNPAPVKDEHCIINALFDEGLCVFHLRKNNYSREELKQLLVQIDKCHHSKIAFHQHHDLALEYGSSRLHYTEDSRKNFYQEINNNKNKQVVFSTSIHHTDAYTTLGQHFHYCFLSPVFDSISKPNYTSIITSSFQLPAYRTTKIIALGGISSAMLPEIKKHAFDGIAVLGAIWNLPEKAITTFKMLKQTWETQEQWH